MDAIVMIITLDVIALAGFIYFTIQDRRETREAKQLKAE